MVGVRHEQKDTTMIIHLEHKQSNFAPVSSDRLATCNWLECLSGLDWANLLGGDCWMHPARLEFADQCEWIKLDGSDWASLLVRQPQFDDRCDWEKLNGSDWTFLLLGGWNDHELEDAAWAGAPRPDLLNRCPWEKLSEDDLDQVFDDPSFPDWVDPKPNYLKLISDLAKEKDPNAISVLDRLKKLGYSEADETCRQTVGRPLENRPARGLSKANNTEHPTT